jgi:predicted RNA binding protein YcfA (HicA-like mRNA interferase family)
MAKAAKLLEKARNQPGGLSFDDFEALLSRLGWVKRGQEGSHRLWYSPKRYRLPVQPAKNGKAKRYQVKQFLDAIEEE